jgi:hypothetical protein
VKIKLDENLPERLVSELDALGHDVDTVRAEHLAGRGDSEVWQAAQSVDRFLITQDLDFSDVRRYTPGTHARDTRPGHTRDCYWCASRGLVAMLCSRASACCSRRRVSISGKAA